MEESTIRAHVLKSDLEHRRWLASDGKSSSIVELRAMHFVHELSLNSDTKRYIEMSQS